MNPTVPGLIAGLADTIADLGEAVDLSLADHDPADLLGMGYVLNGIRSQRQALTVVERMPERWLAQQMRGGKARLDGMLLERRGGWDHDWYTSDLLDRLAEDAAVSDTGELDPERQQLARELLAKLADLASLSWRSTKLKEAGIDPADFRTSTKSRPTVAVTVGDPEPALAESAA